MDGAKAEDSVRADGRRLVVAEAGGDGDEGEFIGLLDAGAGRGAACGGLELGVGELLLDRLKADVDGSVPRGDDKVGGVLVSGLGDLGLGVVLGGLGGVVDREEGQGLEGLGGGGRLDDDVADHAVGEGRVLLGDGDDNLGVAGLQGVKGPLDLVLDDAGVGQLDEGRVEEDVDAASLALELVILADGESLSELGNDGLRRGDELDVGDLEVGLCVGRGLELGVAAAVL